MDRDDTNQEVLEPSADDATVRSVAGLVLRAAEKDEIDHLLETIEDDQDRIFVSELATLASGEHDLNPTSAELLLEEEFTDALPLTEVHEAALLQGIARAKDEGARKVWERALSLLTKQRDD